MYYNVVAQNVVSYEKLYFLYLMCCIIDYDKNYNI